MTERIPQVPPTGLVPATKVANTPDPPKRAPKAKAKAAPAPEPETTETEPTEGD